MIWLIQSNKLHHLKKMEWSFMRNKIKRVFSFCLAHTYISFHIFLPLFSFLLPLADLQRLLGLCLCPELPLLQCLMIDLQYLCSFPPYSPSQVPEWQQLCRFFKINPGMDLLLLNNGYCCQEKTKCCTVSLCWECLLENLAWNIFEPTDGIYFMIGIIKNGCSICF